MSERPTGVPDGAVWDDDDDEWVLAERDDDGRKHGLVTYWRPDGTLVNHCNYEHGVPHGWFKRYHESGAVSREGIFVNGQLHGTDVCHRSATPTTELAFPTDHVADSVWRYEVDRIHGRVITARFYDRDGTQVTDEGEPFPDRPATVPAEAVFMSASASWVHGHFDDQGRKHGLWRYWNRDGIPTAEGDTEHGDEIAVRRFAGVEDAEATVALREGRPADAVAAARRWWRRAQAGSADDRILAGELLARCLGDAADAREERRELYRAVADAPGVAWMFTDEGKRCYQAQAAALAWLADDALAADRVEDALRFCDRAIATEHHYGPCAARVTKVAALRRLGRADEAFQAAREILTVDPDTAGLDDVRADPAFAAWLESIRTDTMTAAGAWETIGERGERLASIAGWFPAAALDDEEEDEEGAEEDEEEAGDLDAAWPIRAVLGERLSPELDRWLDIVPALPADVGRDGRFTPAATSSVSAAVATEDGTWLARLQGLFLPVSAVIVEEEEIRHATWAADSHGASMVFHTHQDEPGFWPNHRSLAAYLAFQLLEEAEDTPTTAPVALQERWRHADAILDKEPVPTWPAHLSVPDLYPRTGWIVQHLLGVELEQDLADAPGVAEWAAEREHAPAWPHLQAYWLLHHLVFDNHEELPFLVEHAERRHPAVAELAAIAEAVLAGGEPTADWWDATAVHGLRTTALDREHTRLMTDAALARLRTTLSTRDGVAAEADLARAALLASGDPTVVGALDLWELLESAAGNLDAYEKAILDKVVDEAEHMDFFMRQHTGATSALLHVFLPLAKQVGPAYRGFFDAVVRRGAGYDEEHECSVPGAIVGLGTSMPDFGAFLARVEEALGAENLGRRRRAELAVVAAERFAQPAARDFLVGEATRFARQLADGDWQFDTVMYGLSRVLDLEPATGGRLLSEALAAAHFSGANWASSVNLVRRAAELRIPEAAPGILAAWDADLGRADDGTRAVVACAYAACAVAGGVAGEAVAALASRLGSVDGVRADCERAALLAGLVTVEPREAGWHARSRTTVETLLTGRMDSLAAGAAIALLKVIDEAGVTGFGDLAERVWTRAGKDEYTDKSLSAWLADAKSRM